MWLFGAARFATNRNVVLLGASLGMFFEGVCQWDFEGVIEYSGGISVPISALGAVDEEKFLNACWTVITSDDQINAGIPFTDFVFDDLMVARLPPPPQSTLTATDDPATQWAATVTTISESEHKICVPLSATVASRHSV